VRIAKDAGREKLEVIAKLRVGVETRAGVVQVDVVLLVQSAVLRLAQRVEQLGGLVRRILAEERLVDGAVSHEDECNWSPAVAD
jgi:hypothetical protein